MRRISRLRETLSDQWARSTGLDRAQATCRHRVRGRMPALERLEGRALLSVGSLDPTFGNGGYVETTFPRPGFAYADRMAVDPRNGDLVVAGDMGDQGVELVMARYLPSGQLDPAFGSAGELTVGNVGRPTAVVVQADGKIVVAANTIAYPGSEVMIGRVGRFNADGTLDTSFGNGGWIADLGPDLAGASALALQGDGEILVADGFGIDRLTSTGQLDTTFNGTGKAPLPGAAFPFGAFAEAVAPDGKIVAAGLNGIARFTSTGQLDTDPVTGFGPATGPEGAPRTGYLASSSFRWGSMVVQSDGEIVLGSSGVYATTPLLTRLNTDGTTDSSFGQSGTVVSQSALQTVALQSDGKILAGAFTGFGPGAQFIITRYDQSGNVDPSFGGTGQVSTLIGQGAPLAALAVTPGGDIVAAGTALSPGEYDFALAAYTPSGSLDGGFGNGGVVTTRFDATAFLDVGYTAVQSDGKILVAGTGYGNNNWQSVALARYLPDGTLDPGFGSGGKALSGYSPSQPYVTGMSLEGDGKILVSVFFYATGPGGGPPGAGVMRFNADGSLDTSFGNNGTALAGPFFPARSGLALQSDGSIVIEGSSGGSLAAARLHADGTLDTSFGTSGLALVPITSGYISFIAGGAALDAAGDILVPGSVSYNGYPVAVTLARITPSGQLDTGFGSGGIIWQYGPLTQATSVAVLPNGKILVGGFTAVNYVGGTFAMEEFRKDGSLATSFGDGGVVTTSFGSGSWYPLSIGPLGTIVTAGMTSNTTGNWLSVAQFLPNGRLDPGFGQGGQTITQIPLYYDHVAVAFQGDGNIVAVGDGSVVLSGDTFTAAAVARFLDYSTLTAASPSSVASVQGTATVVGGQTAITPASPAVAVAPTRLQQRGAHPAGAGLAFAKGSRPVRPPVTAIPSRQRRSLTTAD